MKKNNKTRIIIYVVIIIAIVVAILYFKKPGTVTINPETPKEETPEDMPAISISSKDIKEKNFTGKVAVVSGEGVLAKTAQAYINETVADFKKQADKDVPDMREKFGADSPTADYEINIDAKDIKGGETESIAMLTYTYTGGAHGNSVYKVITVSSGGEILSLGDVIKTDKQSAFTDFVKKELKSWRPDSSMTSSPIFPEEVQALKFNSFANWSLDDKNLTIYFGQYDIGPGALGPVAFTLSREKVKAFLNANY